MMLVSYSASDLIVFSGAYFVYALRIIAKSNYSDAAEWRRCCLRKKTA